MGLIVSHIAPIYFPLLHSNFPGSTNARAACEPDIPSYLQIWSSNDTLNFQIHNDSDFTKDYGIIIGSDFYAGIHQGYGYYNFSIPLLPYLDSIIEPLLIEGTGIGAIITEIDQATPMRIFDPSSDCIICSSLLAYNGSCEELRVYYGPVAGTPAFTHYLRVPAGIEYEQAENTVESYKGSGGRWNIDFAEGDSMFRHFTDFIPLWLLQKLNLIALSKRLWIENAEVIPRSPYRKGEYDRLTNMYRVDGKFLLKKSPYLVATCC